MDTSLPMPISDRGYNDYKLFAHWTENGIFFVTRMKENADNTVIKDNVLPKNRNVHLINLSASIATMPRKTDLISSAEW